MQTNNTEPDYECEINGMGFTIGEIPHGPRKGMWVWSTIDDESRAFSTSAEAQQDAMRHVVELEAEDADRLAEEEDEWLHGSYESQVYNYYYSTRL
jgi:hypothetical protein